MTITFQRPEMTSSVISVGQLTCLLKGSILLDRTSETRVLSLMILQTKVNVSNKGLRRVWRYEMKEIAQVQGGTGQ